MSLPCLYAITSFHFVRENALFTHDTPEIQHFVRENATFTHDTPEIQHFVRKTCHSTHEDYK